MAQNSTLQIDLTNTRFTSPGLYFLKLELSNLTQDTAEIVGLRTEVFGEETTNPNFKQSSFKIQYDSRSCKLAKMIISAQKIDRDAEGKPMVIVMGSLEIALSKVIEHFELDPKYSVKSQFLKDGQSVGEITTSFESPRIAKQGDRRASTGDSATSSATHGTVGRILYARSLINSEKDDISGNESESSVQSLPEQETDIPPLGMSVFQA